MMIMGGLAAHEVWLGLVSEFEPVQQNTLKYRVQASSRM
jgi:hypothetical protein